MPGFLAGDRRRSLIVRAHGDGLIDYSKFDSYYGPDLLRERIMLDLLFSREEAEVIKLRWQKKMLQTILNQGVDRQRNFDELGELYDYFLRSLAPWDETLASTMKKRDPEALKSAWEAEFGRLDAPETQRKLKWYDDKLAEMTGKSKGTR